MVDDDGTGEWTQAERNAIDTGVNQVGTALQAMSAVGGTPQEVFNRVMVDGDTLDYILFVRGDSSTDHDSSGNVDIQVTNPSNSNILYLDVDRGNCQTFQGTGTTQPPATANPRIIACNGPLDNSTLTGDATEYAIIHELGHIFDNRGGITLTTTMDNGAFSVSSCPTTEFSGNLYTVLGRVSPQSGFQRGSRGWGSGPSFSNFQQNPENTATEGAADMFLNWVYRRNSPNAIPIVTGVQRNTDPPLSGCIPIANQTTPFPQNWNGFLNQNWGGITNPFDWGLPGDIRQSLMIDLMTTIFQNNPTW